MTTLGAILAGGQSRRFGSDKALAQLAGKALIEHVGAALLPQIDSLVIVGRTETSGEIPAIPDRPSPGLGPLAGLNAALHHARTLGCTSVLTVPCDMPILPGDLLKRLRDAGAPAFLESAPVVGLWPASLADQLDDYLATATSRSMRGWAAACGARPVKDFFPTLANVNTPGDLSALAGGATGDRC